MSVVINELQAEVTPESGHEALLGDEGAPPAGTSQQQQTVDLLDLNLERRNRLAID